jgi:CCR4-NOT transcription complex subunit 3
MSARKLQQEFDKTNKKIAEGLAAFDDIHEKLVLSDVSSQKEKWESDLKKEIKKLQRLRDQLKTWLGDSSIKLDKQLLQENRTRIERAMDQFKDLEKLLKIKQFSNEGLELQSQRSLRFGRPEDARKNEACNYVSDVIEQLNQQNEALEVEIHLLGVQLKKAKASHTASIQSQIDDERYKVDRNVQHLTRLERILRNLENEKLDPERIEDIRDDLDYYLENNQEDDYVEYDDFYDVLEMADDMEDVQGSLADHDGVSPAVAVAVAAPAAAPAAASAAIPAAATAAAAPAAPAASVAATHATDTTPKRAKAVVATVPPPPLASYLNIIKAAKAPPGLKSATASPVPTPLTPVHSKRDPREKHTPKAPQAQSHQPPPQPQAQQPSLAAPLLAQPPSLTAPPPAPKSFVDTIARLSALPHSRLNHPLPFQVINRLLELLLLNCPDSFDAEKPRQYNPVNTHPSSVDFPQEPMYELNSSSMMRKFDTDTLFFCFYYSQEVDSLARWNSAQELSRRGWAFNKELKQWFARDTRNPGSRDESPLEELGDANYKYFDYEKTWLTRRRENYKFGPELRETFG